MARRGKLVFLTWERIAVSAVGLSFVLFSYVGNKVSNEVEGMRMSISNLNDTMHSLKTDLAISKTNFEIVFKRVDEVKYSVDKVEDRVQILEKKRGG